VSVALKNVEALSAQASSMGSTLARSSVLQVLPRGDR
jgi:hypothetical protein